MCTLSVQVNLLTYVANAEHNAHLKYELRASFEEGFVKVQSSRPVLDFLNVLVMLAIVSVESYQLEPANEISMLVRATKVESEFVKRYYSTILNLRRRLYHR